VDWSRAKTILILSFLFLDLFLAYQLWGEKKQAVLGEISQFQIDELEQRLKDAKIAYGNIPTETPKMHYISIAPEMHLEQEYQGFAKTVKWEGDQVIIRFNRSIPLNHSMPEEERDRVIKEGKRIPAIEDYDFDPYLSQESEWVYNQRIKGYPIFNSLLILSIDQSGWSGYKQSHYQSLEQGVTRKVVSAYTALAVLLENGILTEGEKVESIELGYFVEKNYDTEVKWLVPVWRVIHTNGIHYVNGFTGTMIEGS
jgi:regulatory protein YycI of two-component signal transduction system YycFG